jgi:AcrR family transcriptional regulator
VQIKQNNDIEKNTDRKTDRRTLYTRKVIMDSYIQLLKEKPRDKIKVTEICRLAEINRCTFYLHFYDLSDVEKAIEEELFRKFQNYIETQKPSTKNREMISDTFLETMLHDDTYTTLLASMNQSSFFSNFTSFMKNYYLNILKSALPKGHHLTEREQELLYIFIVGGVTAVEQNWMMNDSDIKSENPFLDKMVHYLMAITAEHTSKEH